MLRKQASVGRRTLFSKFRKATKRVEEFQKDESFHHEYSIRPDTFAFKVSGANEKTRALTRRTAADASAPEADGRHPLQPSERARVGFNLTDFIYRNATNYPFAQRTPQEVFNALPQTNSKRLSQRAARPRRVKMLTSDFIEDALYHPKYGYFSQEVEIFHQEKPFDYGNIADVDEFMDHWQRAYASYRDPKAEGVREKATAAASAAAASAAAAATSKYASRAHRIQQQELAATGQFKQTKNSVQLWHTPTELFSPYYGEALARYLITNYKLNGDYPYHDLVIYEMGGGNGTLMCNVLSYIKTHHPEVYARTQYKIIEISSRLAERQQLNATLVSHGLSTSKVEVVNESIFAWTRVVADPCFFIALEVFDNFAHDLVRYDNTTGEPHQGYVLIDEHGDFYEFFTPELSAYTDSFLRMRESTSQSVLRQSGTWRGRLSTARSLVPFVAKDAIHPLHHSSAKLRWQHTALPFRDNLTPGEFVPTRLLQFFQVLKHKFPHHHLVSSDFHSLPKTIPGYYNAPVVQTVLQDTMVDVTTYMCHQGYFDIMFATDFELAREMYRQVTGKNAKVESHREFLEQWADAEKTETKKGENPMLDFYTNVSFMTS
ncbi:Protein arginine methyltransferase NDUFAF7 [[Candida] zeylanoides]